MRPRTSTMAEAKRIPARAGAYVALLLATGCSNFSPVGSSGRAPVPYDAEGARAADNGHVVRREKAPASPLEVPEPGDPTAARLRSTALDAAGMRIVVSIDDRALWLLDGEEVLVAAPVAVGKSEPFEYAGRRYDFQTPRGKRQVLAKATTPVWVPPDWHYFEKAVERGLEPVHLKPGSRIQLSDSTRIEVRGDQVGRVNRLGNFWPFTPGMEIIFDGKVFIPPFGSAQRQVPEVLGSHKLELGDGYLIHGTNEEGTIGEAVSHGCVRMYNDDVERLYRVVAPGTPVFIF